MNNFSYKFFVFSLLVVNSWHISLWECVLSTVPSPPVQDYSNNIDAVIAEVKKLASPQKCEKPAGYPDHLDVASPIQGVVQILWNMKAAGYDLATLVSEIRFYLDTSSKLSVTEQKHQNSILDIQNKILAAGTYVGSRCSGGIKFKVDIVINKSGYKTKDRTLQQVLNDMYGQTTQVLKYYRNLIKQVASEEYSDETEFTLAPAWFAKGMADFYNSEDIQKCSDEDPQNQAIKEVIKKAWTTGWKYPQAIKIWQDAFALLLYRSAQVVWAAESDASKDAQIKNIVYAYKGWLSNSKFLINGSNLKEFGKRLANQPIQETIKQTWKRIAYENPGYLFLKQVIPNMIKTNKQSTVRAAQVVSSSQTENKRANTERALYNAYGARKAFVWQNKAQDPKTVTSLIQALEELGKMRAQIEENTKLACDDVLNKQATNIPAPRCPEFMKW